MGRSLFSNDLVQYDDPLPQILTEDLYLLRTYLNKRILHVLKWSGTEVAVPISLDIELPPRGNYQGLDIRKKEDVLLIFNTLTYPYTPPEVVSNRKTFPKDKLSHLYISKKDEPAPFCLVRGDYKEWYADKRIVDLIVRIRNWLRDAANGSLVEDGGQFDPMRLAGYSGNVVYKYSDISRIVERKESTVEDANFTFLLIQENERPDAKDGKVIYPSYELIKAFSSLKELKETYKPILEKLALSATGLPIKRILIGAILWHEELKINHNFPPPLPKDLNGLFEFAEWAELDLAALIATVPFVKAPGIEEFPILLGVRRPKPLIGYDGCIEFFNFYLTLKSSSIENNEITKNVSLGFQKHNEPLSVSKARQVAGVDSELGGIVILGCGAVGSKVVMHLIREGQVQKGMLLFDYDKVEPHNMVRYGLTSDSIGMNKAIALQKAAEKIYAHDKASLEILGFPCRGNLLFDLPGLQDCLDDTQWILDFTASTSFENYLITQELRPNNKLAKASIFDEGRLGGLFIEGPDRNPRVDDLKVMLQAEYLTNSVVSDWLVREDLNRRKENTLINVGVGCNSETTVIADDMISVHCGAFSRALKAESIHDEEDNGVIHLTSLVSSGLFSMSSERILVKPLVVFESLDGWQIRIKADVSEVLMGEMGKAMPNETGGTLVGLINQKTKCIYVTDVIFAPPDSESTSVCFVRGKEGLPEQVSLHKKKSGNTFGYIGEWHSHPHGPFGPSGKDIQTMREFKKEYLQQGISIPVFILIATPSGLIPCIH